MLREGTGDCILHLFTSVVFVLSGFGRWEPGAIRALIGGLGTLYLSIGGFVLAALFVLGVSLEGLYVSLGSARLGALSVLCARFFPAKTARLIDRT